MIPDEAVEAAARAYQSALEGTGQPLWEDLPQERRDTRLRWAREALEAAAPHLMAGGTVVDQTVELAEAIRGCEGESPLAVAEAVIAAGYRKVTPR